MTAFLPASPITLAKSYPLTRDAPTRLSAVVNFMQSNSMTQVGHKHENQRTSRNISRFRPQNDSFVRLNRDKNLFFVLRINEKNQ
jgi:hypothetical protein